MYYVPLPLIIALILLVLQYALRVKKTSGNKIPPGI